MKELAKEVAKIVVVLILIVVTMFGYYTLKRDTQVSIVGGRSKGEAVQISYDDTITLKVFIEKNDRMSGMYVYWDNKDDKQKLKKGLFTANGEIEVPDTIGIHKLTIETGFLIEIKYNYYYEVVRGGVG